MLWLFIGLFPDLPYCPSLCSPLHSHSAHSTQLYLSPLHGYPPTKHIPLNCTAARCTATLPLSTYHSTVPQLTALLPSHPVHPINCTAGQWTATLQLSTFHSTVPQPTALLHSHSAHPLNCTAGHCTATLPLSTFHSTVPKPTALLSSHSAHSTQLYRSPLNC